MRSFPTKRFLAVLFVVLVAIGIVIYKRTRAPEPLPQIVVEEKRPQSKKERIGTSVEGRQIEMYTYGEGATHLTFIGGIHGGYEWNSVLLAYTFIDYLEEHPEFVPKNLTITVIPSANPDGLYRVTRKEGRFTIDDVPTDKQVLASGRFNGNTVDLNRNFDCKWQPKSTWQSKIVSAGSAPFSEPEAQAIKKVIDTHRPSAVVFWHSKSNGVYASQCEKGIPEETLTLMNTYAQASRYPAIKTFDAYVTTGAAEDWLASINIPAITVELKTHETTEWEENLLGIKALIAYYEKK